MLRFIKQLLGSEAREAGAPTATAASPRSKAVSRSERATDAYFEALNRLQAAVSKGDYPEAGRLVRTSIGLIPSWVAETRREFGSFDIGSIPALEQGGTVLALLGDDEGLSAVQDVAASIPELAPWREPVAGHRRDRILFQSILEAVASHPGCLQTDVKELVGEKDGRRIATLIHYLEKGGRIVRVRQGRTYKLLLPSSPCIPAEAPRPVVGSHRSEADSPRLREIDVASLDYVPLPRAPLRWEEAQAGRQRQAAPEPEGLFEVRDADWRLGVVEKIPPKERPDPAFRQFHPTASGLFMVDDLGKAEGLGNIAAAALRYDRAGKLVAKRGLDHGVYRLGVHPMGHSLIVLSREGVIHAYDDHLGPLLTTSLHGTPEIEALKKRLHIPDDQVRNHQRCVALSRDAKRYLFTAVDEAWCIDREGKGMWGARLPFKEGWMKAFAPGGQFGTSAEIERALELMGLSLPFTPAALKTRYRELAKEWHPDLNPGDPGADERMKSLTAAAELLTGVDPAALPGFAEGNLFTRELHREQIQVEGIGLEISITMQVSEASAADWIYAAAFAARSDAVYLAGYSGRVVLVDEEGVGVRVYDIGAVPRRIVDTGDFLYLLTDTRLYVLRDDALHAIVDTFDGGDLLVAETGFALLEKKRLRWFGEDGRYLGSVLASDPIRRAYRAPEGMTVETRKHRAVIHGAPGWWE